MRTAPAASASVRPAPRVARAANHGSAKAASANSSTSAAASATLCGAMTRNSTGSRNTAPASGSRMRR